MSNATELPAAYDPAFVEEAAGGVWREEKLFHAEPTDPGEPYCIVIPPPNVTGALHLGHAINTTLQDILIRVHRMRGFNALWIPGTDHAGIATQAVVEKQLKEKENLTRHDVGPEGLRQRIQAWKEQYGNRILEQLRRLGCSCDWDRTRFTLDPMCARAVRETFFKLFRDGLIYRGKRLVNWDTFLQTSISDDEIYHETVKTSLWHIRYPIADSDEYMIVATTRPETMLGDTAVAIHSEDARWKHFLGRNVRLPLTDRLIPIIADDILVDPKFGTGVVKVTPAHDPNDYAVWQRHRGRADEIDLINILTPEGRIIEDSRWRKYSGMPREAARRAVVEDLKSAGLLLKEEPYETQVGHSDRSKTPIEPFLSDQWFVKMAPLAEPALAAVRDQLVRFFPSRFANTFLDWLGEKRDWPVSRQLWWGHQIPVWTFYPANDAASEPDDSPGQAILRELKKLQAAVERYLNDAGESGNYVISPVSPDEYLLRICTRTESADRAIDAFGNFHESYRPRKRALDSKVVCALPHPANLPATKEAAFDLSLLVLGGADSIVHDPDVLDTWFSSALWPHSTLGWPDDTPELRKWYPTSVLVTSRDIITLWVARMVMTGLYNMGAIPFRDVHIHATILDGHGERMSKSKGNGVDPVEIIESHGADALRFTLTQMATETQDVRLPVKKDSRGRNTSEKFDVGRHFCNKIWQVTVHFAIANLAKIAPEPADESNRTLVDRWIVSRFHRTVRTADAALAAYRFDQYAKACYDFFWSDFCDWYVEAVKPALRDPRRAGSTAALVAGLIDGSLRLLHPMIPFLTEALWWRLNEARPERGLPGIPGRPAEPRLIRAAWPSAGAVDDAAEEEFDRIRQVVTAIRNIRNQYNVSPKRSVPVRVAAPPEIAASLNENRELIELTAICRLEVGAPETGSPQTTAAGCDLYVSDLTDPDAERKVNAKRCDDLKRQIAALRGRLASEAYISKAPERLVNETRQQLAAAEAEAQKLGCV